jgi:hypothetical protein
MQHVPASLPFFQQLSWTRGLITAFDLGNVFLLEVESSEHLAVLCGATLCF